MALQPPIQVHCGDETYQLSRLDQKLQDQFGLWCERHAWSVLQHTRANCSVGDYNVLLIEHQRMKRDMEFEFGGNSAADKLLRTRVGTLTLIRMAMAPFRNVDEATAAAIYDQYRQEFTLALQEMFGQKKTIPNSTDAGGGGS